MKPECRFCGNHLKYVFADLGTAPLSNGYLKKEELSNKEINFPLVAYVCEKCLLVQLDVHESPSNIFSHYAYFSSYSESWLKHSEKFAESAIKKFNLSSSSHVIEIASNDGYLLQHFQKSRIPVLGIEPAANVADTAIKKGVPTLKAFFGAELSKELAKEGKLADLVVANNVLAHVPDINDFLTGIENILKPNGVASFEFPSIRFLIEQRQFDTIYHEHFSYLSLYVATKILEKNGLNVFDATELQTHGGSLRLFACKKSYNNQKKSESFSAIMKAEKEMALDTLQPYLEFQQSVFSAKCDLLKLLISIKENNKMIVGYGAAAKGNTLLNFCGIDKQTISFVADKNPHKQGLHLPGSHIPICPPEKILKSKPDYILILPWNLKEEIVEQLKIVKSWGGKFIIPIPKAEIIQ